jgi:putative oxidoreductase
MKLFSKEGNTDIGILVLRVAIGSFMLFGHGLGKLLSFNERFHNFSDPLGFGNEFSYLFAVTAEFLCSILLIAGLKTRLALIPLCITMLVATFIIHLNDPWSKKEFALLFLIPFIVIFISGPGKYSLDAVIENKRTKK